MSHTTPRFVVLSFAFVLGCEAAPNPSAETPATRTPTAPAPEPSTDPKNTAAPSASVAPTAPTGTAFVRSPPGSEGDVVDDCTQVGGNYFSCNGAYRAATDPVVKRYLWRIAQGRAAGRSGYTRVGKPGETDGMPHAEVPYMCQLDKPCGFKSNEGDVNT